MEALRADHAAVDRSREIVVTMPCRTARRTTASTPALAFWRISVYDEDQLAELQQNILLSHACGVGEPVPAEITRLMLQFKIHALGLGQSGISRSTFEQLLRFDKSGLTPWVPSRGSVGASGDLAPLAHLCLPLIGRGEVWNETENGKTAAADAMKLLGIDACPTESQGRSGPDQRYPADDCLRRLCAGTRSGVAKRSRYPGRHEPGSPAGQRRSLRSTNPRHHGPIRARSPSPATFENCWSRAKSWIPTAIAARVQDPYCLRCVPQVHGASRDALDFCARTPSKSN